jgi:hypothetical protein
VNRVQNYILNSHFPRHLLKISVSQLFFIPSTSSTHQKLLYITPLLILAAQLYVEYIILQYISLHRLLRVIFFVVY